MSVFDTLCDFLKFESWATRLREILFQIWKNFYGDFSVVAAFLWGGLFEPYAMSRVVPGFQIGQDVHRRRPEMWTAFHVNGRRSRWESACCDSSKSSPIREVAEEAGICKRSYHLILTDKLEMRRVATKFVLQLLTDVLLIHEFLTKHEATVVPQPPYSPYLAPADFILFPKFKSSLKGRWFQAVEEIEENSLWDLRAIPQNTFQGWKKCWERCIKSGGEYFEGDKFV
jgi:hypothetical protein